MTTDACRILIVDDHIMFRQGLRALLEGFPGLVVVGEAADGLEALEKARHLRPDVVLMDIQMPVCDGLQATLNIRREMPQSKVIVLTVHGDDPDLIYQAIRAGAIGYVPKLSDIDDLVRTIRLVRDGQASIVSPALTSLVTFIGNAADSRRDALSLLETLSSREREVLDLVAEGNRNRQIAARLCISESTVRSHLRNILDKLHLANRVQAATLALAAKQRQGGAERRTEWPPDWRGRSAAAGEREGGASGAPGPSGRRKADSPDSGGAPRSGPRSDAR